MKALFSSSLASIVLLTACSDDNSLSQQATLSKNQNQWQAHAITDYKLTLRQSCYCARAGTHEIYLASGEVVEAYYTGLGNDAERESLDKSEYPSLLNVNKLFSLVSTQIESGYLTQVSYDSEFGFPLTIEYAGPKGAEDIGGSITVLAFE